MSGTIDDSVPTTRSSASPWADDWADQDVPVDERVCLALYSASRAMTARYRPLLAEFDLTYPQFMVLAVLWQDGPHQVGGIAEHLALDVSTLSPLLKRLEGRGLVNRARDIDDERRVIVSLTERGAELEARTAHIPVAICNATGLSVDALTTLVVQINALTAALSSSAQLD